MPTNKLPPSVFDLLARLWPWRDVQYAESVGVIHYDYTPLTIRYTKKQKYRSRPFTFAEARHLVDSGVLTALADEGDTLDIDQQEHDALVFFLGEVAFSWRKCTGRIATQRERRANAIRLHALDKEQARQYAAQIAKLDRNVSHFEKKQ